MKFKSKPKNWFKLTDNHKMQREFELIRDNEKLVWLYKMAVHIIHDIDGTPVEEIMKDLEKLWVLKHNIKVGYKNDN